MYNHICWLELPKKNIYWLEKVNGESDKDPDNLLHYQVTLEIIGSNMQNNMNLPDATY